MKGRIVGLNCGMYNVLADGMLFNIPAKGLFRIKKEKPMVGDFVELDENNIIISKIYERKSFLKRPNVSNVDQLIIVESLVKPEFSYLLAFKFLTYANINSINAKIVLTKKDEFTDNKKIAEICSVFNKLGIETYVISNKTKEGLEDVKKLFRGKTTALIGQTGVGKSSTINSIDPNFNRNIGEYSYALNRGKHKTKEVILLPYLNGYIVDTPGFSSLDLGLYKEDLAIYFPGFYELFTDCYYSNCLHISEKDCAIKKAIKEGKIPQIAYDTYIKLSNETEFRKERYSKWEKLL